jgi:hypothetical protein
MKKALSSGPFRKIALFFVGLLTLSLTGCLDNDNDVQPTQPRSFVSFYHGSPDAPDLDILIGSTKINNSPFKYSDYSNYVTFNPGNVQLKFATVNSQSALIDKALTFREDKAYSLFVVDSLSKIDLLVVQDSLVTPAAGKARVRFLHLSPDAPAADLATTGTGGTTLFTNVGFKGVTEFKEINAGSHSFEVKSAGATTVLKAATNINLTEGRIYTFVFRGLRGLPTGNPKGLEVQLLSAGS